MADTGSWVKRVTLAQSDAEIVAVVRDYLASRDPGEIALLPKELEVPRETTAAEIPDLAFRFAAYHGHGDDHRFVQKVGSVFTRAAVRLAELGNTPAG